MSAQLAVTIPIGAIVSWDSWVWFFSAQDVWLLNRLDLAARETVR